MSSARLEALLQISDTITGTRDFKDLLHLLAPTLKQALDFDYVAVLLHEPETNIMRLHVIEVMFDAEPPSAALPVESGPSGMVLRTQKPLIIDVETETRFPEALAILNKYGIRSCCYLPLTTSVNRVGALT